MKLGEIIKEYRKANKLTQQEFGEKAGVNKQTVSKWENGTLEIGTKKMYEILQLIDIHLDKIVEEKEMSVYKKRHRLNIDLNCLYLSIHDYKSFCWFVDAFVAVWNALRISVDVYGILLVNTTFKEKDSGNKGMPIQAISWDIDYVSISVPHATVRLNEGNISDVKTLESFNNEVYGIQIDTVTGAFLQVILGFIEI